MLFFYADCKKKVSYKRFCLANIKKTYILIKKSLKMFDKTTRLYILFTSCCANNKLRMFKK